MAKIRTFVFIGLLIVLSCEERKQMRAELIGVVTPLDMRESLRKDGHLLPELYFKVLVKNSTDVDEVINVKNYGSGIDTPSRTFWIYYSENDSLELFSGSCEFCLSSQILKPQDSVPLTLAVKYLDVSRLLRSPETVDDEIAKVASTWSFIKYLDTNGKTLFTIQNRHRSTLGN